MRGRIYNRERDEIRENGGDGKDPVEARETKDPEDRRSSTQIGHHFQTSPRTFSFPRSAPAQTANDVFMRVIRSRRRAGFTDEQIRPDLERALVAAGFAPDAERI